MIEFFIFCKFPAEERLLIFLMYVTHNGLWLNPLLPFPARTTITWILILSRMSHDTFRIYISTDIAKWIEGTSNVSFRHKLMKLYSNITMYWTFIQAYREGIIYLVKSSECEIIFCLLSPDTPPPLHVEWSWYDLGCNTPSLQQSEIKGCNLDINAWFTYLQMGVARR